MVIIGWSILIQERESCINNVKLAPSSKDYPVNNNKRSIRSPCNIETNNSSTYTKKPSERFQRGSLENVSSNPWGDLHLDGESSLRRTRSLAITREDIFTNLDRPAASPVAGAASAANNSGYSSKPRRSQLIPRAKLIDRSRESRYGSSKTPSVENLYGGGDRTLTKRNSTIIQDRSPSLDTPTRNRASRQTSATLETSGYSSINNLAGPKFIIGASEQLDSLDSNYHKPPPATRFRVSYEDLPGLSLPNYYPDSKYDDTDNTDNISLTDNISTGSSKKYSSCDNISSGKWTINESERSIPYDENIVLSANKALYDSLNHYAKPKTIRGPTPYNRDHQQTYYRRSYSSDSSEDKQQQQHQQQNVIKEEEKISLNYFETDSNLDEINLNNENITKLVEEDGNNNEKRESSTLSESSIIETQNIDELKIEEEIFERHDNFQNISTNNNENEQYKTIVTVEHQIAEEKEEEESESEEEKNKHSHNYLKEFLESQKGSKKPLQNFLTKKFSNLSRRNSKDINSNLADNRFHSLPDITASKNLRKCEKIDRKLRKCEKSGGAGSLLKKVLPATAASENSVVGGESRFIVNIGKHFDITANTTIPVDFELKIAKIPRKSKLKKTSKSKSEEQFLQAVKNLKQTLNNNNNNSNNNNLAENKNSIYKPEVIAVQTKRVNLEEAEKEIQEITMNLQQEEKTECTKEYQEKLGTMRTYWDKLMNINSINQNNSEKEEKNDDNPHKCKIVDVQTKIDDVKKKFEPEIEVKEPEKPSKVQIAKQLFEKKQPVEKTEKLSPFIKETCNYFERENQFESLNPNIVEIIGKDDGGVKEKSRQPTHKTVSKSQSVAHPEFDHVRYRVVKSDLFQKKIFANCEKESQFDGLMQYLQDYSFQELLRDNNIVIIEPIRTKIPHETRSTLTTKNITPLLHLKKINKPLSSNDELDDDESNANLKRHFFYHPIRVNKEVNDDELPNPDTVKQVRQFFEGGLKRSQSSQEFDGITNVATGTKSQTMSKSPIDPDKDHCSATDSNSNPSNMSDFGSQENLYESITELCCEQQYVSEEILEKIREYGSTVTYYGGRVVKKELGQPTFTKAIMEEIKNNEKRRGECSCVRIQDDGDNKDTYQGVKFKLVKSNSCNSRLELVGTSDLQQAKDKYHCNKQKQMKQQNYLRKVKEDVEYDSIKDISFVDKNAINESIKQQQQQQHQPPRIIAEERKMTQWGEMTKDKTFNGISFSNKSRPKITYDYHNYDNHKTKTKKLDEMEFEQYEIA